MEEKNISNEKGIEIISLINEGKCSEARNIVDSLIDEKVYGMFNKWFIERTKEELKLLYKAIDYKERYFKDMQLTKYAKKLTKCKDVETGEIYQDDFSQTFDLNIAKWRFTIIDNSKYNGICNGEEKLIEIKRDSKDDNIVLLHEMIHAYEYMLSKECEIYKQLVLIELYRKLSSKIPDLIQLIFTDIHSEWMIHTILFMLKSIDLDLRLKKPLGTVYRYGREEFYRKTKIKK